MEQSASPPERADPTEAPIPQQRIDVVCTGIDSSAKRIHNIWDNYACVHVYICRLWNRKMDRKDQRKLKTDGSRWSDQVNNFMFRREKISIIVQKFADRNVVNICSPHAKSFGSIVRIYLLEDEPNGMLHDLFCILIWHRLMLTLLVWLKLLTKV